MNWRKSESLYLFCHSLEGHTGKRYERSQTHRCGSLPWWFCCCCWCSCGSPGSSSSPSSASLWPVAVSSARRFATSCFAHWIAPSIRCASCLFSSIILRIFACGENPRNPRSESYRLLHHKRTKIPFCKCPLFYKRRNPPNSTRRENIFRVPYCLMFGCGCQKERESVKRE